MQSNESNAAKSASGNLMNQNLRQEILKLLANNKIHKFIPEPRYNYPGKKTKQFSPDGEITLLDKSIIVYDNTTTVRHDRLKQKLWDAYGTKEYFKAKNLNIKYYVIIPNELTTKEISNALREKIKINNPEYFSTIDDIITLQEFITLISN
ncbi:hypothetical protein STA3757_10710 [Stanieria sp. NIES-3757]|nr:hypothetical protein STA3757_10710 [Stanieria sp. NIES-3757]